MEPGLHLSPNVIGSYHEEGGVICVSGASGGVQTLTWDITHETCYTHTADGGCV